MRYIRLARLETDTGGKIRSMDDDADYAAAADFRAELRKFLRRSEECARRYGITPRQHLLLLMIAGSEDASSTVSALVERLQLTQSAVTELVQRAEEAGLVRRAQSPHDGRVVDLRLTDKGAERLADVHGALGPERHELRELIEALPD
jgi:DNA-binding MarR family transcriptional regulator